MVYKAPNFQTRYRTKIVWSMLSGFKNVNSHDKYHIYRISQVELQYWLSHIPFLSIYRLKLSYLFLLCNYTHWFISNEKGKLIVSRVCSDFHFLVHIIYYVIVFYLHFIKSLIIFPITQAHMHTHTNIHISLKRNTGKKRKEKNFRKTVKKH